MMGTILIRLLTSKYFWGIGATLALGYFVYSNVLEPIFKPFIDAKLNLVIARDSVKTYDKLYAAATTDGQFKDSLIGKLQVSLQSISKTLQKREAETVILQAKVTDLADGVVIETVHDTVYLEKNFWGKRKVIPKK